MIKLPVDESGRKKASFTRPDVPTDATREVCRTCGGPARTEDVKCWTKALGDHRKRFFSCVNKVRCPKRFEYIELTDEQKEEVMAKARTLAQTPEWCEKIKAGCLEKHVKYQDLGRLAGLSEACLKQALNQHCTLSAESQKRVEDALAAYVPGTPIQNGPRVKPPKKTAAKPKSVKFLPDSDSLRRTAAAMVKETQETILRNMEAQEALPPGATVTWNEEQPKPGLIPPAEPEVPLPKGAVEVIEVGDGAHVTAYEPFQPSDELVVIDVTGPTTFLEEPTGTGKASDAPEPIQGWSGPFVDAIRDLEQRQKALECRVQGVVERTEERFVRMDQEQLELQTEREMLDADTARRFQELEDRITESHNHLSEQIEGQPDPVVRAPFDGLDEWLEENWWRRADRMVQELSAYTDSQLQALVTAATARRDLLKSLEAA